MTALTTAQLDELERKAWSSDYNDAPHGEIEELRARLVRMEAIRSTTTDPRGDRRG